MIKHFLSLLVAGAVILSAATPTLAQAPRGRAPMNIDEMINELDSVVNLTDDQKTEIRELYQGRGDQNRGDQSRGNRQGARPQQGNRPPGGMMGAPGMMGAAPGLENILSAEQMAAYTEHIREQQVDMQLTMLDEQLKLSDEQKASIRQTLTNEVIAREEMMADMRGGGDRQQMMEQFRSLREETSSAIESVLSDDQRSTYQSMNAGRGGAFGRRNR